MSDPEEANDGTELKRLLERLQELTPAPEHPFPQQREDAGLAARQNMFLHRQDAYLEPRALPPPMPRRGGSTVSPWLFVLATALNTIVAAVLAVLITLGVVQQGPGDGGGQPVVAGGRGANPGEARNLVATGAVAASTAQQPVRLLAIGSPAQPLRLEPQQPARLPIVIEPGTARQDTYILVMSGLPSGTTVSGAGRISSDSWLLTPASMSRLDITIPEWSTSLLEIGIELRRTNGSVAAQTRAWILVPPPTMARPAQKLDQAALDEILARGARLLARGDVVAARALYERAAEMGDAQAALTLGSTYDPNRLWSLGVLGMVGNKVRARHWYLRADQLGHAGAKERLRALGE